MSRLQDFPSVTPTASDNILIVQSGGQGLASVGSTLGAKMDKANPSGTGSLSLNRASGSTVGANSVAVGKDNTASGEASFAEGRANTASGIRSHAEGSSNTASGNYSHVEGAGSTASNDEAHAEGSGTIASGPYGSHAEGRETIASGQSSHTEGRETKATANQAHAEGYQTEAKGNSGHAEGYQTKCEGFASHTEGEGTIAQRRGQHVFGNYNIADTQGADANTKGAYIEIVGKGSNDANRSNARTLDWNGNETIAGTLTQSSDARLKEVKNDDIPDVSSIKAVRFNWRKGTGRDFDEHIGYLAQDVEQVLPFLVKTDAEGNKALDYIAFLVAKIDSLEKRISELEKGK